MKALESSQRGTSVDDMKNNKFGILLTLTLYVSFFTCCTSCNMIESDNQHGKPIGDVPDSCCSETDHHSRPAEKESTAELVYRSVFGITQGTTYSIKYSTSTDADITAAIELELDLFNAIFSRYEENSILSRINRGAYTDELPKTMLDALSISRQAWRITDGAFDITVAPLVALWDVETRDQWRPPQKKAIKDALNYVGMDRLQVIRNKLHKDNSKVQIDMNSIAQGLGVDVICECLDELGISNYMVEIGGEVRVKGKNSKGKSWKIGLERPVDTVLPSSPKYNLYAALPLNDRALATSGNYRKFATSEGVRANHIIDPRTGDTIASDLLSATVIAENTAMADALATAFIVMGLEKSRALVTSLAQIDAVLVYAEGDQLKHWMSENIAKELEEL